MADTIFLFIILPSWGLGLTMGIAIGLWFMKDKGDAEG